MKTLPAELHFPKPPFRIERSTIESPPPQEVIGNYLQGVRSWRERVLSALDGATAAPQAGLQRLTQWGRETLKHFWANEWSPEAKARAASSVFNYSAFPAAALSENNQDIETVIDVLRWRAALVDYVGDLWTAWETPDENDLGLLGDLLSPEYGNAMCDLCLADFPDNLARHQQSCFLLEYIRAKWPPMPSAFQRWAKEAHGLDSTAPKLE